MDIADAAVVAVRQEPALLHGQLRPDVARAVFAWTAQNREALVQYWDGELDTLELGAHLRRYEG